MKPKSQIFVVGFFSSSSKPKGLNDYMNNVTQELGNSLKHGIKTRHNGRYMNASLRGVRLHQAVKSYFCCTQTRILPMHRATFPKSSDRIPTDEDFQSRRQEEHH